MGPSGSLREIRPKDPGDGTQWCEFCKAYKKEPCPGPHILIPFTTSAAPLVSLSVVQPNISKDGLLWCNVCKVRKEGPCVLHTDAIPDQLVLPFALASLPQELEIDCKTRMKQKGVFTKVAVTKPTIFGPLVGALSSESSPSTKYVLTLPDGSFKYYRLESDHHCNWLKFVRFAATADAANLLAFQQNNRIYFVSMRPLGAGDELRVGYLSQYAKVIEKSRRNSARLTETEHSDNFTTWKRNLVLQPSSQSLINPFLPDNIDHDGAVAQSENFDIAPDSAWLSVTDSSDSPTQLSSEETELLPQSDPTFSPEPLRKRRRISVEADKRSKVRTRRTRRTRSALTTQPNCREGSREADASSHSNSAVALNEASLRAVIDANPYQYPKRSRTHRGWDEAYEALLRAGFPEAKKNASHNLYMRVDRVMKGYRKMLAEAQTDDEVLSLRQQHPLEQKLLELIEAQPPSVKKTRKLIRPALPSVSESDGESAAGDVTEPATRQRRKPQSSDSTDPLLDSNGTVSVADKLKIVIDVNPYQYSDEDAGAAWNAISDRLTELGCLKSPRIVSNLKMLISRYLKTYQTRLSEATTPDVIADLEREFPLEAQILACKLAPQAVHVGERTLKTVEAVVRANPFQFPQGFAMKACWEKVFEELQAAGYWRDSAPERELANLKGLIRELVKSYRKKVKTYRTKGEEFVAESPLDVLLRDLVELKAKRPPEDRSREPRSKTDRRQTQRVRCRARLTRPVGVGPTPRLMGEKEGYKNVFWRFPCDVCSAVFRTVELLTVHGVKHGKVADTTALSTTCPACGVEHTTLDELMTHLERHERRPSRYKKVTNFQCATCRRHFSSQPFLDRHIRRMHTEVESERDFECSTCREKFITLAALKSHERTHSARKFLECPVCLLGLPFCGQMQEHTESHRAADGQFHCRICSHAFPEFPTLRSHLRQQHDNRIFTCNVCQKVFRRNIALAKHMLVHDATFAFECETCGRRFKRKDKCDEHMQRLHNPDRVYKMKQRSENVAKAFATAEVCQFCTRQYANRERLLIHQRLKHLEKMAVELRFPNNDSAAEEDSDESNTSDSD